MICGILKGGFGNQLFQYAAVRALAKFKNIDYCFDIDALETDAKRDFALQDLLNLDGKICKNAIIKRPNIFKRVIEKLGPWYLRHYIVEVENKTLPYFEQFPNNCIIEGYWQNQGFFKHFDNELHTLLSKKIKKDAQANCVAVHFRGGDYLERNIAAYHGNLTENYYQEAFKLMAKKIPNVQFVLFSDTSQHFQFGFLKDYNAQWHQTVSDVEDFLAMASYQNLIIANSSFSWWAAWFNSKSLENTIICPDKWFKQQEKQGQHPALDNWIRVQAW